MGPFGSKIRSSPFFCISEMGCVPSHPVSSGSRDITGVRRIPTFWQPPWYHKRSTIEAARALQDVLDLPTSHIRLLLLSSEELHLQLVHSQLLHSRQRNRNHRLIYSGRIFLTKGINQIRSLDAIDSSAGYQIRPYGAGSSYQISPDGMINGER